MLRLAILFALALAAGAPPPANAEVQRIADLNVRVDWDTGKVQATGSVPAPAKGKEAAARAAALDQARKNLKTGLERLAKAALPLSTYEIPSGAKLAEFVAAAAVASAGVAGGQYQVTVGATLARRDPSADDPVVGEMKVPVYTEPDPEKVVKFEPLPPNDEAALLTPAETKGPFTGIIVDARGLPVKRSMAPRVVDAALRDVYSGAHASMDYLEDIGVAGYATSIAAALKLPRVGNKPLVVRAVGLGDATGICPAISLEDARRILGDGGVTAIFTKCSVCIVMDAPG